MATAVHYTAHRHQHGVSHQHVHPRKASPTSTSDQHAGKQRQLRSTFPCSASTQPNNRQHKGKLSTHQCSVCCAWLRLVYERFSVHNQSSRSHGCLREKAQPLLTPASQSQLSTQSQCTTAAIKTIASTQPTRSRACIKVTSLQGSKHITFRQLLRPAAGSSVTRCAGPAGNGGCSSAQPCTAHTCLLLSWQAPPHARCVSATQQN